MDAKVKLDVLTDLGGEMNIGYPRTDVPIVHVIVRAPGGAAFTAKSIQDHFADCAVCKTHGVTFEMFDQFMQEQR